MRQVNQMRKQKHSGSARVHFEEAGAKWKVRVNDYANQ
jgi:hypothetical protein